MHLNINPKNIKFWFHPPAKGYPEKFYDYQFKPDCLVGEELHFYFNDKLVGTAIVSRVIRLTKRSGGWRVLWLYSTMQDLRNAELTLPLSLEGASNAGRK